MNLPVQKTRVTLDKLECVGPLAEPEACFAWLRLELDSFPEICDYDGELIGSRILHLVVMLPATFFERFCARFKRPPSDADRVIFTMLFYPIWVPVARILLFLFPSMFKVDFEIIDNLGTARSMAEVRCETDLLPVLYKSAWIRQWVRFRLSGKRILAMAAILFADEIVGEPKRK